ncbi:MAG: M20/M25/M40 family metallo-hydrolase [Gammaproteobacteria bacterium]|nr:M20/M25/M40 family metallo-hydrolase [Gammaproteobacteria bacterium]
MLRLLAAGLLILLSTTLNAQSILHHQLKVELNPETGDIHVTDFITLPTQIDAADIQFLLNQNLEITHSSLKLKKTQNKIITSTLGAVASQYRLEAKGQSELEISYHGRIQNQLSAANENYARNFDETAGIISEEGVFLATQSLWFPLFDEQMLSFELEVKLPKDWLSISQGERKQSQIVKSQRIDMWSMPKAQDDIYLIAGRFKQYEQVGEAVKAMVFLRQADPALAQKYLDTTETYVELYERLIGEYPYEKFAMVENFWETGYGMPSFTLLGSQVIRFPFILHSSYPHEILHNWWGNSVFVDYERGNWAEGLTAYLADHLIQAQKGQGMMYRRGVLQKYSDYVNDGKDFALTDFQSRHSSASEAVGYGKTLMLFHMLRLKIGDEHFRQGLRQLYRDYRFKQAGYADLQAVFSEVSSQGLSHFFQQWQTRIGAPQLKIVRAQQKNNQLHIQLQQTQNEPAYELDIPLAISLSGQKTAEQVVLHMQQKSQSFDVLIEGQANRIDLDPEFDVFRRLAPQEIPPALSQGFGSAKVLIVLPSRGDRGFKRAYESLAQQWQQSQAGAWEIVWDNQIKQLPDDRAVWLIGWRNQFLPAFQQRFADTDVSWQKQSVTIAGKNWNANQHAIVLTARHKNNPAQTLLWLGSHDINAIAGLARKLPHYRKYSYLAFTGDAPDNVLKGQWQVLLSPMSQVFDATQAIPAQMQKREPLIQAAEHFSKKRMMGDIRFLASEQLKGRGIGTKALDSAANYIVEQFKLSGLRPAWNNQYRQTWTADLGADKGKTNLSNVLAMVPGTNPKYKDQVVIVSAHYDHLGLGWPDVHKGDEGKIHYGADDNASGVAVMLEFARYVKDTWKPERSILFVAFSAEEANRLGSEYFVQHAGYQPEQIIGVVNLDTVGRLGAKPLQVFGIDSASEWVHIFRGIGFVTGIKINPIREDIGSSDQTSFINRGIAAVQLFSGAHEDFHRPSDTIEKIDAEGLVKVAEVLLQAVDYLASRETLMTLPGQQPSSASKSSSGRKVSVGTIPDFSFVGEGVRIQDIIAGSPAEKVGLAEADVLVKLNQNVIKNLRDYAQALRQLQPGETITLVYLRKGKQHQVKLKVEAR